MRRIACITGIRSSRPQEVERIKGPTRPTEQEQPKWSVTILCLSFTECYCSNGRLSISKIEHSKRQTVPCYHSETDFAKLNSLCLKWNTDWHWWVRSGGQSNNLKWQLPKEFVDFILIEPPSKGIVKLSSSVEEGRESRAFIIIAELNKKLISLERLSCIKSRITKDYIGSVYEVITGQ